jgi:uncharacterized membrane protein YciS (DUF1049 family)
MGVYVTWIISIIVILILVTFGTENNQTVQLKYYIDSLTIGLPQYVLVYAAIIILGFGMSKLPYRRNTMYHIGGTPCQSRHSTVCQKSACAYDFEADF